MLTKAPRGTKDILPDKVGNWLYLENLIRKLCGQYGYREIRTPIFEHTELFHNRMYKREEFAFLLCKRRLGRSGYGKIIHLRDISVSLN